MSHRFAISDLKLPVDPVHGVVELLIEKVMAITYM